MLRKLGMSLGALALVGFGCATSVQNQGSGGSSQGGGDTGGTTSSSSSSSSGAPGTCTTAADCHIDPGMPNHECLQAACINGMCGGLPANELGACEDGKQCTENDTCQQGVCVGGAAKFCPSDDSCHVGSCDVTLDTCIQVPGNDGASCVDDDACTLPGTCFGGACQSGGPVDCSFLDGTCSVGFCDPQIGCKVMPQNDGTPCDDNLFCTVGDVCMNGQCVGGGPNICAPPGGCYIGVCNEAMKSCTSAPGNDGQPCDDFNACTTATTCSNGACINGQPTNEGQLCDDGSGCTQNTICINGACAGGIGPTVYFADDFHDNSKGWQLDTEWQIGPAMASPPATFNPDPAQDHTPTADNGVAGVVIGGNENPVIHPFYYLTSPPFNTAGAQTVILGFYRWLNSDYDPFMHNTIDVWNGAAWINVWTSGGPPGIEDNAWTFFSYDLTASKNAAMRIRFGYDITSDGVFTVSSWNIDDVLVASAACP